MAFLYRTLHLNEFPGWRDFSSEPTSATVRAIAGPPDDRILARSGAMVPAGPGRIAPFRLAKPGKNLFLTFFWAEPPAGQACGMLSKSWIF